MVSHDKTLGMRLPSWLLERLERFRSRKNVSVTCLIRNVLEAVPFDDDTVVPVVLKLPKAVAADPRRLELWLADASAEIQEFFGQT